MTKITDNETFRRYIITQATKRNTTITAMVTQIANYLGFAQSTVEGWVLISRPKPLNARTAALIQAAIERGDI